MATPKILTNPDRQTLEIPLEELQEAREIWYSICAFKQMLNKLDGDEDDLFALRQFHKPIKERFTDLMAGEPAWDQRMVEVEMESEELTHPETDRPPMYKITKYEYDMVKNSYQRALEISNMIDADKEVSVRAINTLLEPIYEDLSSVVEGAQEVKGGGA